MYSMCNKIFLLGRVAYIVTKYLIRSMHVRESVLYSSGFRPTWRRRGGEGKKSKAVRKGAESREQKNPARKTGGDILVSDRLFIIV